MTGGIFTPSLLAQLLRGIYMHAGFITRLLLLSALMISATPVAAQQLPDSTRAYYETYRRHITTRFYFSKKYTDLRLGAARPLRSLHYRPNNAFNAGLGASYGVATLNLGFNLGFLDQHRDQRGKTNFLDLQSHIYSRNWVIDLYGQFYRGYYLSPRGTAAAPPDAYYLRRDLHINVLGTSVYRLLSPGRFSYRAAFLQTEWQQRSAGSWLLGFEAYHGSVKADSAFVPGMLANNYEQRDVQKLLFTEFGPGVGYAYTGVWKRHFFVTGSLSLNGDLSFVREYIGSNSVQRVTVSPNLTVRAVAGYNSASWSAALSWVDQTINLRGQTSKQEYFIHTGNLRLTVAKRLQPGKKLRARLKPIE